MKFFAISNILRNVRVVQPQQILSDTAGLQIDKTYKREPDVSNVWFVKFLQLGPPPLQRGSGGPMPELRLPRKRVGVCVLRRSANEEVKLLRGDL